MKVINPATEEVLAQVKEDTRESVSKKFETLTKGKVKWQQTGLEERIALIEKFSRLLHENQEKLALTLTREVGKPLQQSRNEIASARGRIKWMLENAGKYLSDEIMFSDHVIEERIRYEPLGVICNISAWNYPYLVGVNVFIPALLGGNTVMYKPSELATLTGLEIDRLLKESGIPDDVFQTAIGGKDTGEFLLDQSFDGYFFTGSYKTGQYIFERVAPRMIPCHCELGGKDPIYIADDITDVSSVAAATADGAFYNNGQSCCAVERIYVHEKIYDRYIEAFLKEVNQFKTGDPEEDGTYIGPLTRKEQLAVLENQLEEATARGARVLTGGKRMRRDGYYFEPTVLTNVQQDMEVMRQESFGPLIGIMKVSDDQEAVAKMNDTEYGLTASVYSSDRERAFHILSQLDTGTGYWNCCDRVSAALPWSGRKNSGFGSSLSHAGLRAFVRPKAFHLKRP